MDKFTIDGQVILYLIENERKVELKRKQDGRPKRTFS